MVDYIHFPTLGVVKAHLIINCVVSALAYTAVVLRLISRRISGAGLGWDDWFAILAVPQAVGMLVMQGWYSVLGVGYPMTQTLPNLPLILRILVAYETVFATSAYTTKLSVLFFYLRVFVEPSLRRTTKITLTFVSLWTVGNILQVFLICRPFKATYDPTVKGECGSQVASFIAIGAFNVITDFIILALPIKTVWSLNTTVKLRIAVIGVLTVGVLVSVISIARMVTLTKLDMLGDLTGTMIWADWLSALEPNAAVLCISLPMLKPLITRSGRKGTQASGSYAGTGPRSQRSRPVRLKDGPLDDSFAMETIYAPAMEPHHEAAANRVPSRDGSGSVDGSETELSPRKPTDGRGIAVERKWAITTQKDMSQGHGRR